MDQSNGNVLVGDLGHSITDVFSAGGGYLSQFGPSTTPPIPTGTPDPFDVAVDNSCQYRGLSGSACTSADPANGDSYVVDYNNPVLDVYRSVGSYVSQISLPSYGNEVTVDQGTGNVWVSIFGANEVVEYSPTGTQLSTITGTPGGPFGPTWGVAVDPGTGDLYVDDSGHGVVDKLSSSGTLLSQLTVDANPIFGLAVDPASGHLYIADRQTSVVNEFDASGNFLGSIDATANSVAVSAATGDVYVNDATSNRVFVFGPDVVLPDATTGAASNLAPTSATLNGSVSPDGTTISDCHFDYGTTTAYGQTAACASTPSGSSPVPVSADLTGLSPGTTYHFRLVAANSNGATDGQDQTFTTPGPRIDAESSNGVGATGATLAAQINPQGQDTTYHFEYGTTTAYGQSVPVPDADIGSGTSDVAVSQAISGLAPGTKYHFRVVASNAGGTDDGPDRVFTTLPSVVLGVQPPTGLSDASGLSNGTATLNVYLNPNGQDTRYHFDYGTTSGYGSSTPEADAGSGSSLALESTQASGLSPGTTYHYRTVASNSLGTITGPDATFTTPPSSCPNAQFRAGLSASLPECRAFEQVSPTDKAGYGAQKATVAAGGGRVIFQSQGSFAGQPSGAEATPDYLAQRAPTGWVTAGIDPPPSLGEEYGTEGSSADLSQSLAGLALGPSNVDSDLQTSAAWFMRRGDGSFAQASPTFTRTDGGHVAPVDTQFRTADLSHIFFGYLGRDGQGRLLSSAAAGASSLYEVVGAGGPSPQLRLASVDPSGNPVPVCQSQPADAISSDGSKVFFGGTGGNFPGCGAGGIVARIGGQSTVVLGSGLFGGASLDGSKVFFTNGGLYEYDFNQPGGHNRIDLSAGDTSGGGPQVDGVVRVSDDGSTVYFVAGGVLTSEPNSLGASAQPGADNLYRVDTATGAVTFIAELCSGQGMSGSVSGLAQCPASATDLTPRLGTGAVGLKLTGSGGLGDGGFQSPSDVSPDGRFLVFSSFGQLTPGDTNQAADVYEYDSQTGGLWRVSVGHDGQDQNGNGGGQDVSAGRTPSGGLGGDAVSPTVGLDQRVVSDDGQTVVFTTARPLQNSATNGAINVYEWHQGEVTLISGGQSPIGSDQRVAITPSGQDIVFNTDQGLVAQDTDGLEDMYDARIGGGFPAPPAAGAPCQGDACQGPASGTPGLPLAASVSFSGPGNATPGRVAPTGKARVLTRTVHGWRFLVAVTVPAAGRITVTGGGIRSVRVSVRRAGTFRIRVTLTPAARKALKHKRKLRLALHVRYVPSGGTPSTALVRITDKA